jgi:ABC-type bacteriocin/lantibiotic exporter with double-glycine peptidase domain
MIHFDAIDKSWTLFLDRDGVINKDKEGDYIRHAGEFFFLHGVEQAIEFFSGLFGKIVVVCILFFIIIFVFFLYVCYVAFTFLFFVLFLRLSFLLYTFLPKIMRKNNKK